MSNLPIQATYASGSTINVEWLISANHGGRIGLKLCPRRTNLNQACFDANPLQVGDRIISEALLVVCDADCEDWRHKAQLPYTLHGRTAKALCPHLDEPSSLLQPHYLRHQRQHTGSRRCVLKLPN